MSNHPNQKMTLLCIARELLKNIWVVLALALSLSFLGFMAAKVSFTPTYTSQTTFVVSRKGSSDVAYSNMQQTSGMMDTFRTVMNSPVLHKRVCQAMGLSAMPGSISVDVVQGTNLITMKATAGRPDLAFQLLKNTLKVYPEVGDKVLGEVILEVFEKPQYPAQPDRTFRGMKVMTGIFTLSFFVILGIMAAAAYVKDTVKSKQDVREKLDTSLFATVYHERQYKNLWQLLRRKHKLMRLNDPSVSFLYEETMKKISTRLLYRMKTTQAKIVLITSTLPGEGKSTLAMNLAQDMAHRGKKVLLLEGDLKQPGLARVMQIPKSVPLTNWGTCLKTGEDPNGFVLRIKPYSFDVLLNNIPMPEAASRMTYPSLSSLLNLFRSTYDVILIDAPPVQHRSDTEVLAHCADLSLLVVRQDLAQTRFINDAVDMLEGYGSGLLGCVLNDAIQDRGFVSGNYGYGYGYGYGRGYGHYGEGQYGHYHK